MNATRYSMPDGSPRPPRAQAHVVSAAEMSSLLVRGAASPARQRSLARSWSASEQRELFGGSAEGRVWCSTRMAALPQPDDRRPARNRDTQYVGTANPC